ncbi:hypothetical protein SASPL_127919 [Salvia splendens]|uniref:Uncharacterized protein n=1 Tax=Salvia splendens TaxID=180675 RepID=A0A8X8ZLL8_SALSN|nr:hypothetical protein SASPL_127919 [Salvia splendens]
MEESSLTQLEMDAVLQLFKLSRGDSYSAADFHLLWLDFPKEIKQRVAEKENTEEIVGETTTSSSSVINPEKLLEEALPRRRKRVLPLADIYRKTAPMISKRALKRCQN